MNAYGDAAGIKADAQKKIKMEVENKMERSKEIFGNKMSDSVDYGEVKNHKSF